jgi:DNA-directed RNA polymerase specialized sigma24 family protein
LTPIQLHNLELIERIKTGDRSAITEIIEDNMKLAEWHVERLLKAWGYPQNIRREDLCEVAYFALAKAANKKTLLTTPWPGGYLSRCITGAVRNLVTREWRRGGIGGGRSACRLARYENDEGPERGRVAPPPALNNEIAHIDLKDAIAAACEDDTDRLITTMKGEGYKVKEIADVAGADPATIYRRLQQLRDKIGKNLELDAKEQG